MIFDYNTSHKRNILYTALAQDEEIPNKRICYGYGDLDCWDGSKAEYIVIMFSLDVE